jgi:hypothetical protein
VKSCPAQHVREKQNWLPAKVGRKELTMKLADFIYTPSSFESASLGYYEDYAQGRPGAGYHTWYSRWDILREIGEEEITDLRKTHCRDKVEAIIREKEMVVHTAYAIGGLSNGCRATFVCVTDRCGVPVMTGCAAGLTLPVPVRPWDANKIVPKGVQPSPLLLPGEIPGFKAEWPNDHRQGWYTKSRLSYEIMPTEEQALPWQSWPEPAQNAPRFFYLREGVYVHWSSGSGYKDKDQSRLIPHRPVGDGGYNFWAKYQNVPLLARQGDLWVLPAHSPEANSSEALLIRNLSADMGRHSIKEAGVTIGLSGEPLDADVEDRRGNHYDLRYQAPFTLVHPEHADVLVSASAGLVCLRRAPGESRPFATSGGGTD